MTARLPFSRCLLLVCSLAMLALAPPPARAQMHGGVQLVQADLLADTSAVTPGKPFIVGLRLRMQPHWHTYYLYSGDAGLPTKIDWQLPPGFQAGPLQWPVPETIVSPGDIINYGYDDEVVLLTEITPPAALPPGGPVTLAGKATWLVCADICVPGSQQVALKLPAGGDAQPANAEIIAKYRALLPKPFDEKAAGFGLSASLQGNDAVWTLVGLHPQAGRKVEFFPLPPDAVQVGHPVVETAGDGSGGQDFDIRQPISDGLDHARELNGVVAIRGDGQPTVGWVISGAGLVAKGVAPAKYESGSAKPSTGAPADSGAPGAASVRTVPGAPVAAAKTGLAVPPVTGSLLYFLLIGFLGGLILNVMPCVLPVISLKLFSFIKHANGDPGRVWRMGLAYAAGVFAWFLGVAAVVVLFKASGRAVGNGFQLQNPWFVVGLVAVTFVFALSLVGVFEVVLPGSVNNTLGEAAGSREGYLGAFLQGLLATVLGSACTAPLFGPALGFAFAQNGIVVFAVFAAIAAGMSAPFVLIAARPQWLHFLPKPGAWMERVKQAMGFILLATVLWLLYVLGQQRGADAVVWAGALLLALGAAAWVQGTFNTFAASERARWASRAAIFALAVGGGWFCLGQIREAHLPEGGSGGPFAPQLAAALKTGRPVFVDFTAAWCVNCKVYEKTVLSTEPVQKALQDRNAVFLKADYTNESPDITHLLQRFGRAAVPMYVLYPAGQPDAPILLPEIITQGIVLDAFKEADRRAPAATGKPIAAR